VYVHTNKDGRTDDGRPATAEGAIENNGECFVGDDVAQEQGDKDPVLAALEQLEHLLRIFALAAITGMGEDLQVDFVLAHQTREGALVRWLHNGGERV
jgi:hypothetical protein